MSKELERMVAELDLVWVNSEACGSDALKHLSDVFHVVVQRVLNTPGHRGGMTLQIYDLYNPKLCPSMFERLLARLPLKRAS